MTNIDQISAPLTERQLKSIRKAIARNSYCTLATASAENRPLVVGVLYAVVDDFLYVSTLSSSAKVRNLAENDRVAVCIPVRRYPVGPPFSLQFQGRAEVRSIEDTEISALVEAGQLKRITSHGELDDPAACILKISPAPRMATYGFGLSLLELLRDPLHGSRSFEVRW